MRFKNMGTKSILAHMNLFIIKHHPYTVIFGNPAKQMILMLQREQNTPLVWPDQKLMLTNHPSKKNKTKTNAEWTEKAHWKLCLKLKMTSVHYVHTSSYAKKWKMSAYW